METRDALIVSQVVLLFHYIVYIPIMLRDPRCTTSVVWGSIGSLGRYVASLSALVAYVLHLTQLWMFRNRKEVGLWMSSLLFYILQTAFLPYLHSANCEGIEVYKWLTRILLGVCAGVMIWYTWTVWKLKKSLFERVSSLFIAFHVTVMDFLYFGFSAV